MINLTLEEEDNFNFTAVMSGKEALNYAQENQVDLILLDAIMDEMDGFETCQRLKTLAQLKYTPIIMVTGLDDVDSITKGFASGASAFVTKPINFPILIQMINFQLNAAHHTRALDLSNIRLNQAQNMAKLGCWSWDSQQDKLTFSSFLSTMLGLNNTSGGLDFYLNLVHPDDKEMVKVSMQSLLSGIKSSSINYRIQHSTVSLYVRQELLQHANDKHIIVGTIQDISHQKAAEDEIRQLAFYDPLTSLASRSYFNMHLEESIRDARRRQESFAVFYLDLDGFKDVNDSLGHHAGDELLKAIANRIQDNLRENDCASRLGGDEFALISTMIEDELGAAEIAERLLELINQPIELKKKQIKPRVSIGIAYFPTDGKSPEELLKAADSAMYSAKEQGKHRYAFYRPELTQEAEYRLQMENDLRQSISKNQLVLHYQPQVQLDTQKLVALEALVRWQHPEKGLIPPDDFISLAERIGFIIELGNWVLLTACQQAKDWLDQGYKPFRLAVNISPIHFAEGIIIEHVKKVLEQTQWPAEYLELEVTESVAQSDENIEQIFTQLRALGIHIAIDDFGTGYSSLASLKNLSIDILKIDKMFIHDIVENEQARTLVDNIIGMGHALGHTIIAEGAESLAQVSELTNLHTDIVQGYHYSKPLPIEQITDLLIKK